MGPRSIHIDFNGRSGPASIASDEDELHETGVHVSPVGASPPYSVVHPQSQSGSSSHPGDYVHLQYPSELQQEPDVYPYDSASRLDRRDRPRASRTHSSRKDAAGRRRVQGQAASRSRQRAAPTDSATDSGDSTEEFLGKPDYDTGMPRPQSYYGPNGYTHSSSSGSYGYPPVPPSGQMIHYQYPPQMHPYQQHQQQQHHHHPHQYPPMSSPPPMGYPPAQQGYHPGMNQPPDPRRGPQYRPGPYGQPLVHYGAPGGYFPPGHPGSYYQQPGAQQYPPPLPAFMHEWQVASHSRVASPPAAPAAAPKEEKKPDVDQDEIISRVEKILLAANAEREVEEKKRQLAIQSAEDQAAAIRKAEQERAIEEARIRADAIRAATEQAEAAARAQVARAAEEARIRKEAAEAAKQALLDAQAAAAEQAAHEAKIRKEAAEAALEAAAAQAKAKAEQEAKEAKIAADAAEAAKTAAEKKAADDAAAAEAAAKAEKEEADKKVKEAEEAAEKAKAEAEVAQAAAAAAAPPEKKPPVRFKDAIGRNYNFPWDRCCKWRDMENLIIQAFQHIEDLGEHVINGRYDLIGPDKEIIMPQYWDSIIQPDMHITMMLWPLPEKPPEPEPELMPGPDAMPPNIPDGVIDLDELLNPRRKEKKGKKPKASGFSSWMLGGVPSRTRKPLKDDKKPGTAAASQHGAVQQDSCIVI